METGAFCGYLRGGAVFAAVPGTQVASPGGAGPVRGALWGRLSAAGPQGQGADLAHDLRRGRGRGRLSGAGPQGQGTDLAHDLRRGRRRIPGGTGGRPQRPGCAGPGGRDHGQSPGEGAGPPVVDHRQQLSKIPGKGTGEAPPGPAVFPLLPGHRRPFAGAVPGFSEGGGALAGGGGPATAHPAGPAPAQPGL